MNTLFRSQEIGGHDCSTMMPSVLELCKALDFEPLPCGHGIYKSLDEGLTWQHSDKATQEYTRHAVHIP